MAQRFAGFTALAVILSFWAEACHAQESVTAQEIAALKARVLELEDKMAASPGAPQASGGRMLEGIELGLGATLIVQGTDNVNSAAEGVQTKTSRTDATYSADITLGKEFEEAGGEAFLHLESGQGAGIEDDLSVYSNVNRDSDNDNNVRLTELWYEQSLLGEQAAFTFGKLDPTGYFDGNEAANDETSQFLGRIFRNSPVIAFPDNGPGLRLRYTARDFLELGAGIFDADSDWEDSGDALFTIGQAAVLTRINSLPGNYRFLAWHSNADHAKWLDTEMVKKDNYGWGLSFDQEVLGGVTLFTRYGWQNPRVFNPGLMATGDLNYSLEHAWSAGAQLGGKLWGREKDVASFAVGQAIASDEYKKAGFGSDPARRARAEGHLEAFYRIFVNDHLSLSPDIQYIWNPFGKDVAADTSGIFIAGLRAQLVY